MRWYLTTVCFYWYFNPVYPGLRMYILYTVLYAFSNVLTRRICLTIKRFFRLVNISYLYLIWNQWWSLLCHWLSSMWLIKKSHHFFPLSHVFFSANDTALLKDNNQSDFKALLKLQTKLEENEGQLFNFVETSSALEQ